MTSDQVKSNQDIFNEAVARVLAHLWEKHPEAVSFPGRIDKVFPGLSSRESRVYYETVTWLSQEGFLATEHHEVLGRYAGSTTRLTMQGMVLLGQVPASIQTDAAGQASTFGQQLAGMLKSGALQAAGLLAKEALLEAGRSLMRP